MVEQKILPTKNRPGDRLQLIRRKVLAARLCVSEWSLMRWEKQGLIPPPIRLGGGVFWRLDDIENWLEERAGKSSERAPEVANET